MPIKALIVDDEYPARRELRVQLSSFPGVEVVGEAASAEEARQLIHALPYDVVFLDIEMPGASGIDLVRELAKSPRPQVVFTTAYPQYAVEAFQVGASGYLLKPFDEDRLGQVLDRLVTTKPGATTRGETTTPEQSVASAPVGPQPRSSSPLPRIPVEKGSKTLLVSAGEISFIYAQEEQVFVKLHSERLHCRYTLRELDEKLTPYGFLRVHRRFLVNVEKVREVIPYFKGSLTLVVADADRTEVPVSRALTPLVRQRLGLKDL